MSDSPKRSREHDELARKLTSAARESASATLFFHQAIANRLNLNVTDLKCAEIVSRRGEVSAGELAELCGLTSGAATTMLDRLESHGFVRRERDHVDRRRVLVKPIEDPERDARLVQLFAPLNAAMLELCEHYSEDQLRTVLDVFQRSREVLERETLRLTKPSS